jgi:hypothetical protein
MHAPAPKEEAGLIRAVGVSGFAAHIVDSSHRVRAFVLIEPSRARHPFQHGRAGAQRCAPLSFPGAKIIPVLAIVVIIWILAYATLKQFEITVSFCRLHLVLCNSATFS